MKKLMFLIVLLGAVACQKTSGDILIKNGLIVDGSGRPSFKADLLLDDGKIICINQSVHADVQVVIDAANRVVAPGFIDMLSWACGPVLYDGQVASVVHQGITTAIFGEGWSMGPLNERVREEMRGWWPEYNIDYRWETLADYLHLVERQGTAINVASYVGATTLRIFVIGHDNRQASADELQQMKQLLRREMDAGALGLASSLVYTPAFYANTNELIELAKVAAEYGGVYASHLRSESYDITQALDEFLSICEQAKISGEIYHLKAAGKENWPKLLEIITRIEQARAHGLNVTADIYPYTAAGTGLDAMMPPWAKEGGTPALLTRLQNHALREKIKNEILTSTTGWENFYRMADSGKNIMISYLSEKNKALQGKTLAEIAQLRGENELGTLCDLLLEEEGGGGGIYFVMSEENVRKKMQLPWVSFCTDEDSYRPEGLMSQRHPHPRAYGSFPRILGKYVREEKLIALEDAIRRMTSLPAQKLGLPNRGLIKENMAADLVIFDPLTINDPATFTQPHQFAAGIDYVLVNGKLVIDKGIQTAALPGKAIVKSVIRQR